MKIALLSPNPQHLATLAAALDARGHDTAAWAGGKSRMEEIAAQEQPQLLLVDGLCCDPGELSQVAAITARHPQLAVVLLCSIHTPESLIEAMRAGVREVLPSPPPMDDLVAAVQRVEARVSAAAPRPQGRILAFQPCKGGSGATFLATSLARLLSQTRSVLLVDLNLQFGDALSFVHDGRAPATVADVARDVRRLDATLLAAGTVKVAPGFSVLAAPEDFGQAVEVTPQQVDALLALAVQQHDFVVLDLPRTLDPVTLAALDRAWRIFPVLQAALPDLRHATRLLETFRSLGYAADKTQPILNRHDRHAEIGLDHVQRALGSARVRTVPNAWKAVSGSINHGEALPRDGRGAAVARQLADLVQALDPAPEPSRGLLDRLLRRAS